MSNDDVARTPSTNRRKLGIAVLALTASALVAQTAEAFPRHFRTTLRHANRLLRRFGLQVTGQTGAHDVLTVNAVENSRTEYDFVVSERAATGGLEPCVKTTFFNDVATFEHFERVNGELDPCVRTVVDGPFISFEHFDLEESAIVPCLRTTVEGEVATFEHFDPDKSPINPCWKAEVVESDERAGADTTTITVFDRDIDFAVVVGDRTWRLVGGALVETR